MIDANNSQQQLGEISKNTRHGVKALQSISRNSKASLVNRSLLIGLALLAIDALIVSDFQPQVALAILRESPWMAVLVGTLLNLLPIIVPVLGTTLLMFSAMKLCSADFRDGITKLVQSFLVFAVAWLTLDQKLVWSPSVMLCVFVGVLIVGLIVGSKWGYSDFVEQFSGIIMLFTFVAAIALTLANSAVSGALARPYASAEIFTVGSGNDTEQVVGYALSIDPSGQWTTLLVEEDRRLQFFSSENIRDRELCEPGEQARFTPWWTLFVSGHDPSERESLSYVPIERSSTQIQPCPKN